VEAFNQQLEERGAKVLGQGETASSKGQGAAERRLLRRAGEGKRRIKNSGAAGYSFFGDSTGANAEKHPGRWD